MGTIIHLAMMWMVAAGAIVKVTLRRLLLGPTLPSWSWMTEWTIAATRGVIETAARYRDDPVINRFGLRVRAPVPPRLRGKVRVDRIAFGSLEADRYLRLGEATDTATLLYFHGGGYIFGNPGTHRQMLSRLVDATGTRAFAPRYRLAPQHRFPAAVDDAIAAYKELLKQGIDPRTVVVGGDSAGGGLALAMTHRARRKGLPLPGGVITFSPYVDLRHTAYTISLNAATDYLPLSELSEPNTWYADADHLDDPEASPIEADLTAFPPMLTFAGGAEMLLDDAVRIHHHARRDGVDTTLVVEPEMMHVWPAIVPWQPESPAALDTCSAWINQVVVRNT